MSKFVKLSFENENGKYRFYLTEEQLHDLLKAETFTSTIIDAKNGRSWKHGEDILSELKIEKPKE